MQRAHGETIYIIIWEFRVKPGRSHEFVAACKADGDWAKLFGLADGYAGTELFNSVDDEGRFVTVDRWRRATDFLTFQEQFGDEYRSLDIQLEGLTESETKLGVFTAADDLPLSDVKLLLPNGP
jgi:heme-degrading monooxygenase HmoA